MLVQSELWLAWEEMWDRRAVRIAESIAEREEM